MRRLNFFIFFFIVLSFTKSVFAETNIQLIPDLRLNPGPRSLYTEIVSAEDRKLKVNIKVHEISEPLFGVAFDLLFDSAILQFENFQPGNFFEKKQAPLYLVKPSSNDPGRLINGISLKRGDTQALGTGTLVTLNFQIKKNGASNLQFQNVSLMTLKQDLKKIADIKPQDSFLNISGLIPGGTFASIFEIANNRSYEVGGIILLMSFCLLAILKFRSNRYTAKEP